MSEVKPMFPGERQSSSSAGFSIVEIMVGMAIAMLAIIVMTQMFALSEGQKRTTTSGADATGNGLIALTTLERDLRMAGYGLASSTLFSATGCSHIQWYYNGAQPPLRLAPVTIGDGGPGLSDTVTVVFGNAMIGTIPATMVSINQKPQCTAPTSVEYCVDRTAGFNNGDLFVVAQGGQPCQLLQATNVQPSASKLQHNTGGSPYNPPAAQVPPYTAGAQIFNLGQMTDRTYSSSASNLQVVENTTQSTTALVSNIVNIQAQYGIAPPSGSIGYPIVNCWVNATGLGSNACDGSDWSNPTAANIARIKAVRIAVVARSTLPEKPSVTGGACDATTNPPASWNGGPAIDLSADPNWQCYRYKVYQTIVPLRNVIWANI